MKNNSEKTFITDSSMKLCILLGLPDTDCSSGIILSKYLVRKKHPSYNGLLTQKVPCFQLLVFFLLLNLIAARYNYDELVITVDHYMYQLLGKTAIVQAATIRLITRSYRFIYICSITNGKLK